MLKRYNNTIYKQFLKNKKIIKVVLNNITRIRLIIYIKYPKNTFSVNYIYIKKNTIIKEIIIVNNITTSYFIKSNTIFIINWDTS